MEYFLAVVEHGGLNRAARALHVAQPSLSQSVRKLEKDLGTELFHRVGRGLVLAPAGNELIGRARAILREVEAARIAVRDVSAVRGGTIEIAAQSDLSADPLSVWVAKFRADHPAVRFRIEEREDAGDVAALVRSGACELGVVSTPMPRSDLAGEVLVEQRLVLVCPPGTEDRWTSPVPFSALDGAAFVMGEKGTAARDFLERELRAHGAEPDVVVEVRQRGAVLPIVQAGGGVAVLPLRIAVEAMHHGVVVRELEPSLKRGIGLIHRPGSLTAASQTFLTHAKQRLAEWVEALERQVASGSTLIRAAEVTVAAMDRRVRELNLERSKDQ
ncbi:LysR family transcriptional regulator [Nocardioides sp. Soil796]|nr:LysR family transcriptional regulator [Nocardioides sp. Soil796]